MKIESKWSKIEVVKDILTFENKVKSRLKKGTYNYKIVNTEDIKRLKEFLKKFKKSMYINFYIDFENDRVEIEFESVKDSKRRESLIIEILDIN